MQPVDSKAALISVLAVGRGRRVGSGVGRAAGDAGGHAVGHQPWGRSPTCRWISVFPGTGRLATCPTTSGSWHVPRLDTCHCRSVGARRCGRHAAKRRPAQRRVLYRRPAGLGGRRPGRHPAHRRRRPNVVRADLRRGRRLRSVCFLDEQLGWAAGGQTRPYVHAGTGTLLATRDGGRTWTQNPHLVLPTLWRIGFFDPQHGWAVGCRSALYPAGLMLTGDGGRSWQSLPGDNGWTAADFLAPGIGALAGPRGALAAVREGRIAGAAGRRRGPARLSPNCGSAERARVGWRATAGWCKGATTWVRPGEARPATCRRRRPSSILPPWPPAGRTVWIAGSPGQPRFSLCRLRPKLGGVCHRLAAAAARDHLCQQPARLGGRASSARCWPPATAARPGGFSVAAVRGPRSWCSPPSPATCRWSCWPESGRQRRLSHRRRRSRPPRLGDRAARGRSLGRSPARGGCGRRRLGELPAPGSSPCGKRASVSSAADCRGLAAGRRPRRHGRTARPAGPRNPHLAAGRGPDRQRRSAAGRGRCVSLVRQATAEAVGEAAGSEPFSRPDHATRDSNPAGQAGLRRRAGPPRHGAAPSSSIRGNSRRHWDARRPRRPRDRAVCCATISHPRRRRSASSRSAAACHRFSQCHWLRQCRTRRPPRRARPAANRNDLAAGPRDLFAAWRLRRAAAGAAPSTAARPLARPAATAGRRSGPVRAPGPKRRDMSGPFSNVRCAVGRPASSCWPSSTS